MYTSVCLEQHHSPHTWVDITTCYWPLLQRTNVRTSEFKISRVAVNWHRQTDVYLSRALPMATRSVWKLENQLTGRDPWSSLAHASEPSPTGAELPHGTRLAWCNIVHSSNDSSSANQSQIWTHKHKTEKLHGVQIEQGARVGVNRSIVTLYATLKNNPQTRSYVYIGNKMLGTTGHK